MKHGKIQGLRTLDALQLATYIISKANTWQLLVSDKTLFETANVLKIKAMYV
jgi:hypothetical protein